MININKNDVIKKWIPILGIVTIIVLTLGIIFGISITQIISSILVSVLLIFSALFFRSVGRDRENQKGVSSTSTSNSENEDK
jgi:purine-cytosine permease-like protein